MSITQEYDLHHNYINKKTMQALRQYLDSPNIKGRYLTYDKVVYSKSEWEKFEKWYNEEYGRGTKRNQKIQ